MINRDNQRIDFEAVSRREIETNRTVRSPTCSRQFTQNGQRKRKKNDRTICVAYFIARICVDRPQTIHKQQTQSVISTDSSTTLVRRSIKSNATWKCVQSEFAAASRVPPIVFAIETKTDWFRGWTMDSLASSLRHPSVYSHSFSFISFIFGIRHSFPFFTFSPKQSATPFRFSTSPIDMDFENGFPEWRCCESENCKNYCLPFVSVPSIWWIKLSTKHKMNTCKTCIRGWRQICTIRYK